MKALGKTMAVLATAIALSGCGVAVFDKEGALKGVDAAVASHNGQSEQRLVGTYKRKPKVYDFADGSRELTWRWQRTAPKSVHWCELNVVIDRNGTATKASYRRRNSRGSIEMCQRIVNLG